MPNPHCCEAFLSGSQEPLTATQRLKTLHRRSSTLHLDLIKLTIDRDF